MLRFMCLRYLRCDSLSLATEIRGARHASRALNRSVVQTRASASAIMTNQLDIKKCFEYAKRLTLEAGEIVKRGFQEEKVIETKEVEWDLVTNFDHKVEDFFIDGLKKQYPDHKIIAEEATASKKEVTELTDSPTWLLDPIDGTTNFIHAFPQCCISLGLAVCKEIVIGIVYNPISSELYTAVKGEGALLNGEPIRTSRVTELKKSLIILEPFVLRMSSRNRDIRVGRFEALVSATRGVRSIGSAALALAYVARGSIDCFHMDALQPWDVAAGMLILCEAGGTVIDTKGGQYDFMKPNTIAAANENLASETSKLIIETDLKTQRKRLQRS